MANKIVLKKSSVAGKVPVTGDLDYGELAINYADGKLYFKSSSNTIEFFTVDPIIVITKSITMTTDWQDTGIKYNDLATGTYIVQLFANDTGAGGTNTNEYYSGTMSWYAGDTNSSVELPTDEIPLHRAGGGSDAGLYLRTYRTATGNTDRLKLQVYSNQASSSASNYVFKFRRII